MSQEKNRQVSAGSFGISAAMAELADALDLGSSGQPCRFKSCWPQTKTGMPRVLCGRSIHEVPAAFLLLVQISRQRFIADLAGNSSHIFSELFVP